MSNLELFSQRVRDTREGLGATVEEIALFSHLSPERVISIESGKDQSVNALEIHQLGIALGVTYNYLMFGKVEA